jgi:hypothetical protein
MSIQNNRIIGGLKLANSFLRSVANVTLWDQNRSEDIAQESHTTTSTCCGNAERMRKSGTVF